MKKLLLTAALFLFLPSIVFPQFSIGVDLTGLTKPRKVSTEVSGSPWKSVYNHLGGTQTEDGVIYTSSYAVEAPVYGIRLEQQSKNTIFYTSILGDLTKVVDHSTPGPMPYELSFRVARLDIGALRLWQVQEKVAIAYGPRIGYTHNWIDWKTGSYNGLAPSKRDLIYAGEGIGSGWALTGELTGGFRLQLPENLTLIYDMSFGYERGRGGYKWYALRLDNTTGEMLPGERYTNLTRYFAHTESVWRMNYTASLSLVYQFHKD